MRPRVRRGRPGAGASAAPGWRFEEILKDPGETGTRLARDASASGRPKLDQLGDPDPGRRRRRGRRMAARLGGTAVQPPFRSATNTGLDALEQSAAALEQLDQIVANILDPRPHPPPPRRSGGCRHHPQAVTASRTTSQTPQPPPPPKPRRPSPLHQPPPSATSYGAPTCPSTATLFVGRRRPSARPRPAPARRQNRRPHGHRRRGQNPGSPPSSSTATAPTSCGGVFWLSLIASQSAPPVAAAATSFKRFVEFYLLQQPPRLSAGGVSPIRCTAGSLRDQKKRIRPARPACGEERRTPAIMTASPSGRTRGRCSAVSGGANKTGRSRRLARPDTACLKRAGEARTSSWPWMIAGLDFDYVIADRGNGGRTFCARLAMQQG